MVNYEYKIISSREIEDLEKLINDYASKGWDIINLSCDSPYQSITSFYCLIRRIKIL